LRRPSGFGNSGRFTLLSCFLLVIAVKAVLVDVVDDLVWDIVADTLTPLAEEANLGRRDVVLYELWDNANVVPPLLELDERIVYN